MKRSVFKLRMTAKDWAWGPTAYWKVCSSAKKSALPLIDSSFVRSISTTVAVYQENLLRVYKNVAIRARKAVRPKYYGMQNHGRFGPALNSILANKKHKNHQFRRNYMNEHANIVLSTEEINRILRAQEHTSILESNLVSRVDFNELSSNKPMEDQSFAYKNSFDDGLIIGLLDGHGGSSFSEKVRNYLPLYVSAALIDQSLGNVLDSDFHGGLLAESFMRNSTICDDNFLNERLLNFAKEVAAKTPSDQPGGSFSTYVRQMFGPPLVGENIDSDDIADISDLLKEAFMRLDVDMINSIIEKSKNGHLKSGNLNLTASGCCALVASINGPDLHVANAGDCRAVMGSFHDGEWAAIQLTHDHTASKYWGLLL